jgi:hypothetical protein
LHPLSTKSSSENREEDDANHLNGLPVVLFYQYILQTEPPSIDTAQRRATYHDFFDFFSVGFEKYARVAIIKNVSYNIFSDR